MSMPHLGETFPRTLTVVGATMMELGSPDAQQLAGIIRELREELCVIARKDDKPVLTDATLEALLSKCCEISVNRRKMTLSPEVNEAIRALIHAVLQDFSAAVQKFSVDAGEAAPEGETHCEEVDSFESMLTEIIVGYYARNPERKRPNKIGRVSQLPFELRREILYCLFTEVFVRATHSRKKFIEGITSVSELMDRAASRQAAATALCKVFDGHLHKESAAAFFAHVAPGLRNQSEKRLGDGIFGSLLTNGSFSIKKGGS